MSAGTTPIPRHGVATVEPLEALCAALRSAGVHTHLAASTLAVSAGSAGSVRTVVAHGSRPNGAFRLLDLWPTERDGAWMVRVLLGGGEAFLLHTATLDAEGGYPSAARVSPAAAWLERALVETSPIRPHDPSVHLAPKTAPLDTVEGRGVFIFPFGPVRSGIVESMRYDVATAGEDMLLTVPCTGYKRRGLERRLCELPFDQAGLVAERMAGVFSVAGALAVCQAIEAAAGVTVSPEAQAIRAVLAELERIFNHCDTIMKLCDDASLVVGVAQMGILKERVLRLLAALTGHRYARGVVVPGGVARPLSAVALGDELRRFGDNFAKVRRLLLATDSFLDRLERTGEIPPADAAALGTSGPVARGSTLHRDARWERPYGQYRVQGIQAAVMSDCDAMARMEVRMAEIGESLRYVLDTLTTADLTSAPPPEAIRLEQGRIGVGWAESPEGEWIAVVEGGAHGRLASAHVRPASVLNFAAFQRACAGWVLTDFAFIEHSFGLSVAGCDR